MFCHRNPFNWQNPVILTKPCYTDKTLLLTETRLSERPNPSIIDWLATQLCWVCHAKTYFVTETRFVRETQLRIKFLFDTETYPVTETLSRIKILFVTEILFVRETHQCQQSWLASWAVPNGTRWNPFRHWNPSVRETLFTNRNLFRHRKPHQRQQSWLASWAVPNPA